MVLFEIIYWLCLGIILYTYFGYPALTSVLSLFIKNPVKKSEIEPAVTFLITAYNEERNIADKLENTLLLDYPRDKLEIIVASDGSTDQTDEIVMGFKNRGVILHRVEGRVGKTETQNQTVKIANGDVIIFSDATTDYKKDAIKKIVRNYADPSVGAVSGRYEYVNPTGAPVGKGTILFWKYENFIKSRQTRINTITGCCGCIYSVRRELYTPLPGDIISDLVEPLKIIEKGYRIAFEPEAVAYETTEDDVSDEFSMRVRVITRAMKGLSYVKTLLNPLKYPFVAYQLNSHKVARWLIPLFLIIIFLCNLFLLGDWFYRFTFLLQILFYGSAIYALVLDRKGKNIGPLSVPMFFCIINTASLRAAYNHVTNKKMTTWETVRK